MPAGRSPPDYHQLLVTEMPGAGKHHSDAVLVAGLDGLLVANGATRLDDRGNTVLGEDVNVIAERQEGIGRGDHALGRDTHALAGGLGALAWTRFSKGQRSLVWYMRRIPRL